MEISCCLCLEGTRIILEDEIGGEDDGSSYKCCRGDVHVKRACFYVSISALVVCLFSTICMFFGVYTVNLWLDIFLIVANTVVAILMMFGLYYDKASLLVPFIVSEITQCVCFFILANYVLYYTIVFRRQKFYQKFDQMLMVISIYLGIVICIGAIWAATKCYHYLRQKAEGIYPDSGERCMWE
ncbi:MARVEL domain-containing protein [Caenorhabditis elegans]|uniref:MARVEL domain-containing protein n=1 Tax=Caenorhabditis elegans TaxID=6239 RepID=Q4PIV7_CAEEL|nr:MARVEL domain-containing protein [Caenorhabditis elegans]CCD68814.2 MARVEL domain-containing protein [Caenorhabditis elegans]